MKTSMKYFHLAIGP